MSPKPPIWLVLLLLVTVLMVCIAPSVDLEPTALRANRAAAAILLAIVVAAQFVLRLPYLPSYSKQEFSWLLLFACVPAAEDKNFLDQYCSRLC